MKKMIIYVICFMLAGSSIALARGNSKIFVDGYDYSLPTTFDPKGNRDDSAINEEGTPLAAVYFENEPSEDSEDSSISGFVDTNDDGVSDSNISVGAEDGGSWVAWEAYAESLINNSDTVTVSSLDSHSDFGTRDVPQITFVTEYDTISGNIAGAGILIIGAGAKITGNVYFEGLIIMLTDNIIDGNIDPDNNNGQGNDMDNTTKFLTGNPSVYGAVVVVGKNPFEVEIGGSSELKYSSEAIANLNKLPGIGGSTVGKILSWREI